MLELVVSGQGKLFDLERVVNAGYSGRDREAVREHVEETVAEGIPEPESVPTLYPLAPWALLVDPSAVAVVGERTSGEAEFGLLVTGRETYVVAASDQTDRELETRSIQKSKQIAPNVISREAWLLSQVRDHWDAVELRAWNTVDGERTLYQEATLGDVLEPETILDEVRERYGGPLYGTAVLSGTVATVSGHLQPGSRFAVELYDPELDRALTVDYDVHPIPE